MWILILYAYANALASGDSVAFTSTSFTTQKACVAAGDKASEMARGTAKTIRYICVSAT